MPDVRAHELALNEIERAAQMQQSAIVEAIEETEAKLRALKALQQRANGLVHIAPRGTA